MGLEMLVLVEGDDILKLDWNTGDNCLNEAIAI
jgi:hypothetical protein